MSTDNKTTLFAAVITGGLASVCCLGPLLVISLGLGSASAFIAMAAYRPIFAIMTLALLGWAGWQYWQSRNKCMLTGCTARKPTRLYLLGGLAILFLVSPALIPLFL